MNPFCPACGVKLQSEARFCPACGHALAQESPPPPPAVPSPALPVSLSPENLLQMAKTLPWKQRPEAWWNLISVLAGSFGGLLWLIYSSIRGLPKPDFLARSSLGVYTDFIPAAVMLFLAWVKRRTLATLVLRLQQKFERQTLGGRLILGGLLVGGGHFGMRLVNRFGGEGLDLLTPVLMTLLPMGLVLFRQETDRLLQPLQPLRRTLGPVVTAGMSVAAPFATAHLLYHAFDYRMYELMHMNVPCGLLLSYALARNPAGPASGGTRPPLLPHTALWFWWGALLCLMAQPALAHDFLRDPFNLNDGLRTDTFAPWLAGLPTSIVTILVNGVEITKVVIQGPAAVKEGETPEVSHFQVVVRSTDEKGAISTVLTPGQCTRVLAHCEKSGGHFAAGDATISFSQQDAHQHVTLTTAGNRGIDRCVELRLVDPPPSSAPPETVTVLVTAGKDGLISAPVTLRLNDNQYDLEFF